ncbi:MAG: PAS domain S-box protein [Magnetococcales bacterium]|nr:PAS domain S-box protein [Magnetococcales bacterium]
MKQTLDYPVKTTQEISYAAILNAFDVPAMVVRKDRMVLDANLLARDCGVQPPCYCWNTLGRGQFVSAEDRICFATTGIPRAGTRCTHCKADESLARQQANKIRRVLDGEIWEHQYIPLNTNFFLYIARHLDSADQSNDPRPPLPSTMLQKRLAYLERDNKRLQNENRQLRRRKEKRLRQVTQPMPDFDIAFLDPQFRNAFIFAAHGMALVALDGQWLKVNRALCEITGYDERELLMRTFQDITHPEDLELDLQQVHELLSGMTNSYQMEKRYLRKDGSDVWVLLSVSLIRDPQGHPHHFVSQIIDINDRKNYETRLAHGYALIRSLIDTIPDLIFIKDNDLRFIGCNRAFEIRTGRCEQEILGTNCFDLFPADEALSYYNSDLQMLAKGNSVSLEEVVETKSGERHYYETIKTPFYDAEHEPLGLIGICRDITERKLHEFALNRSKQDAETASRAKGEFLANMSHEIRTPLSTILGTCEILQETRLTKTQSNYVQRMERSGRMLLVIINDILDLSKIEANQIVLERIPFSLTQIIDETLEVFTLSAQKKGITLAKRIIDDSMTSLRLGDPNRLRQVLINLVGNALKFTSQGSIQLSVAPDADTGGHTVISVADTGPGIALERQQEIFLPFRQVDASIARTHGGTGLGLTICRRLVELMGGTITLTSTLGQGSIFSCFIPLSGCDASEVVPPVEIREVSHSVVHAPLTGLEILLAEDTEEISLMIDAYLQPTPHRLTIVQNGAEAVDAVKSRHFDLILMDLQMPVLDGFSATKTIRAIERTEGRPPVPILALTAHVLDEESARIQAAGFNIHLTKPISKQHLLEVLAAYSATNISPK